MDAERARSWIDRVWDTEIVPALVDYVRIPARSPEFDPDWERSGHIDRAVELVHGWCKARAVEGLQTEVVRLPGRTPLLLMEVPGRGSDTVLLYGHLDKQPEMEGWRDGLGPWTPVLDGDRLYGRGGADDGYAAFASLTALEALHEQGVAHARCVILIEASEESGSPDLPAYIDHLADRIGDPSLVVCLDSGCGNYDQLWCTTSLRGMAAGVLRVRVLTEGVHSGDASGVVPSSFRVARALLDRVEDATTGAVALPELRVEIPEDRVAQARAAARVLGSGLHERFPFPAGAGPMARDGTELVLNRTWRPFLEVTGAEGLPPLGSAGNVLRPETALKLSMRLPPTADPDAATAALRQEIERDPPHGAQVSFEAEGAAPGWNAPPLASWLERALEDASRTWFGPEAVHMGEGGTIPFMGMLGERFPGAQFLVTGVLGPESNAHGPNEFLHLPTARRLTGCVAQILATHASR